MFEHKSGIPREILYEEYDVAHHHPLVESGGLRVMKFNAKRLTIVECFTYDLAEPQGFRKCFQAFLVKSSYQAVVLYRLSQRKSGFWASSIWKLNLQLNCVDISPRAVIGRGLRMDHPVGIVVGKHVRAGCNLTLFQHVTLGQNDGGYPVLGDGVTIYVGASVLGDVHVGDGAVIGAHSLVLSDVPANAVVAGVPARIIRKTDERPGDLPSEVSLNQSLRL